MSSSSENTNTNCHPAFNARETNADTPLVPSSANGNVELKNVIVVYDYAAINGGAAKVAIQSAIALSEQQLNVIYFAAVGPIDEALRKSSVKVVCLGQDDINTGSRWIAATRGIWNTAAARSLREVLSGFSRLDTVIHFHGWTKALSSSVIKAASDMGFTTIVTLHDFFAACPNGGLYNYRKQTICHKRPMSAACVFCDCDKRSYPQKIWRVIRQIVQDSVVRNNEKTAYISISDLNEKLLRQHLKSTRFYRVQNPAQLAKNRIPDCRKSNQYLFVGRVSDEKGPGLFCQVISELKKQYNIEGILVGDGESLPSLRKAYPDIVYTGWKSAEEVASYIQKARALIIPSKCYETAPTQVLLEAYSAALPSVVPDICAATELIRDGENGFVFKSNDIASLKEKIVETLDDAVLFRIQKTIEEELSPDLFSIATHTGKLVSVYTDCLAHR